MNDQIKPQEQASVTPPSLAAEANAPSMGRRRFTRAGMAAPVVLGSLMSRPVLAAGDRPPYNCTISGQMSGNLSNHPDQVNCKTLGKSPGYWKNHTNWPGNLIAGELPTGTCSFSTNGKGSVFDSAFGSDAFRYASVTTTQGPNTSSSCVVRDAREGFSSLSDPAATMLQVLNTGGGLNDSELKALGRAAVASLLNALAFTPTYPLTTGQVIKMFNDVYLGGMYYVNSSTSWNASQVKAYFESLYGA